MLYVYDTPPTNTQLENTRCRRSAVESGKGQQGYKEQTRAARGSRPGNLPGPRLGLGPKLESSLPMIVCGSMLRGLIWTACTAVGCVATRDVGGRLRHGPDAAASSAGRDGRAV